MIGWIVENTRRSGWRQKWRRFRIVTTPISVTLDSTSRSEGARGSRRGCSTGFSLDVTAGLGDLPYVLARGPAGQLEEDIVERRSAQAHVADANPCAT